MNIEKIKTYVGFAIKSRKIAYGIDNIFKTKHTKLIIISDDLGDSSLQKIEKFAKEKTYVVNLSKNDCEKIFDNPNIKAVAVLDENLADAIKKNLAE